jgi:hypothetical protein
VLVLLGCTGVPALLVLLVLVVALVAGGLSAPDPATVAKEERAVQRLGARLGTPTRLASGGGFVHVTVSDYWHDLGHGARREQAENIVAAWIAACQAEGLPEAPALFVRDPEGRQLAMWEHIGGLAVDD